MEAALLVAVTVRFAAAGLLIVAAIGKASTVRREVESGQRVVIVGLSTVELLAGVGLLLPIAGLPSAFAAALFLGFAGAQAVGRSVGEKRPCGCYGDAAPNAVFSYGAVVVFLCLASAIAATTIVDVPMDEASQIDFRVLGLAVAVLILALIRRESHPASTRGLPADASTTS